LALDIFYTLREPAMKAVGWYQLGMVAQEQKEWIEAERCYRQALGFMELLSDERGAADTCDQLAMIAEETGRLTEAEGWYKQALELDVRIQPDSSSHAIHLSNLADLLLTEVQAGHSPVARLVEAKQYAEQALVMKKKLDADAAIWTTLSILAEIAHLEGQTEEVQKYRRLEQETFAAFEGNHYFIDQQFGSLIGVIVAATLGDIHAQVQIQAVLPQLEAGGWHIALAIEHIWEGTRDWYSLTKELDRRSALFVLRVLETLAQPPQTRNKAEVQGIMSALTHEGLEHQEIVAFARPPKEEGTSEEDA
jgi:tetratricopeptide (TPR) repeat protein